MGGLSRAGDPPDGLNRPVPTLDDVHCQAMLNDLDPLRRDLPLSRLASPRSAFTAIEMVIVIGIMMLIMAMAVPAVLPALRKGALRAAVNDIEDCWAQAQIMAKRSSLPSGSNPPHFGIMIRQEAGSRPSVALIRDSSGPGVEAAFVHQDDDTSKPPVALRRFNRNVIVATATDATGATLDTADRVLVVYAQYQSGLPISAADVAAGRGMVAAPTSLGVRAASSLPASTCPAFELRTLDYVPAQRGYALGVQLYHAGFIAVETIRE